jgi:hypothetical protein
MKLLNITVLLVTIALSSCGQNNHQQTSNRLAVTTLSDDSSFNFNNDDTGIMPPNWSVALTGNGSMCSWQVLNIDGNKVMAQTSTQDDGYRFNIAVNNKLNYRNVSISVKFKGVSGNEDQGGGPVWRYIDSQNYYVVRANPLENNYRLYKVVNGRRTELKSADIDIKTGKWYNLKITMKGNTIKCYFNGKLQLQTNDDTFTDAGKIGLWTKSDAVTYFDDMQVTKL